MAYLDNDVKIIIAVDAKLAAATPGRAANRIGHLACAIGRATTDLVTTDYRDAEGRLVATLSRWPVVVLAARSPRHLLEFAEGAETGGLLVQRFTAPMDAASEAEQAAGVAATPIREQALEAVATIGSATTLAPLTRRLSLLR